jgi:hypothetical protein
MGSSERQSVAAIEPMTMGVWHKEAGNHSISAEDFDRVNGSRENARPKLRNPAATADFPFAWTTRQ